MIWSVHFGTSTDLTNDLRSPWIGHTTTFSKRSSRKREGRKRLVRPRMVFWKDAWVEWALERRMLWNSKSKNVKESRWTKSRNLLTWSVTVKVCMYKSTNHQPMRIKNIKVYSIRARYKVLSSFKRVSEEVRLFREQLKARSHLRKLLTWKPWQTSRQTSQSKATLIGLRVSSMTWMLWKSDNRLIRYISKRRIQLKAKPISFSEIKLPTYSTMTTTKWWRTLKSEKPSVRKSKSTTHPRQQFLCLIWWMLLWNRTRIFL